MSSPLPSRTTAAGVVLAHPLAGTAAVVVPALVALACVRSIGPSGPVAAALFAYLATGTVAGFSVSGST